VTEGSHQKKKGPIPAQEFIVRGTKKGEGEGASKNFYKEKRGKGKRTSYASSDAVHSLGRRGKREKERKRPRRIPDPQSRTGQSSSPGDEKRKRKKHTERRRVRLELAKETESLNSAGSSARKYS